jgi:hypothetical protein
MPIFFLPQFRHRLKEKGGVWSILIVWLGIWQQSLFNAVTDTGIIIIIIIIIIILGISFVQGIYTYIPETNYVPREHRVCSYSVTIHGAYIAIYYYYYYYPRYLLYAGYLHLYSWDKPCL